MAGGASGHLHVLGMRIFLHTDVAGRATQVAVNTVFVLGGIDVQALAGLGLHGGIAMTGETILIRRERLRRAGNGEDKGDPEQHSELFRCLHGRIPPTKFLRG